MADMTLSKLLRINYPDKEIILIPVLRLHSMKENVSKACNQWHNQTHCLNKIFFIYCGIYTHLLQLYPDIEGNFSFLHL